MHDPDPGIHGRAPYKLFINDPASEKCLYRLRWTIGVDGRPNNASLLERLKSRPPRGLLVYDAIVVDSLGSIVAEYKSPVRKGLTNLPE
jgi:hypothetical protein